MGALDVKIIVHWKSSFGLDLAVETTLLDLAQVFIV